MVHFQLLQLTVIITTDVMNAPIGIALTTIVLAVIVFNAVWIMSLEGVTIGEQFTEVTISILVGNASVEQ